MLSVERNYLLVKSHLIGGPTERHIPPRTLAQVGIFLVVLEILSGFYNKVLTDIKRNV